MQPSKQKTVEECSIEELETILVKKRAERHEKIRFAREMANKVVIENIQALLSLVPNHSTKRCSDDNRGCNPTCVRCIFLEARDMGYLSTLFQVKLEIIRDETWT